MKDGKPEVLIIGEEHSTWHYGFSETDKKIKIPLRLTFKALRHFITSDELASQIIHNEIEAIKKFRARRILGERPYSEESERISAELLRTRNLARFRRMYRTYIETIKGRQLANPYNALILSYVIIMTGVYDMHFFDESERYKRPMLLETEEDKKGAEKRMIANIKKLLRDRTVVICGARHLKGIIRGLRQSVYLHDPYRIQWDDETKSLEVLRIPL